MQIAGIGRVVFWEGGSLWLALMTGVSELHSHHAIQLSLPLSGLAQFKERGGEWQSYAAAIIPPDLPHAFQAPGRVVANLLFEPESAAGRTTLSMFGCSGIKALEAAQVRHVAEPFAAAYFADAPDEQLVILAKNAVAAISGVEAGSAAIDPRVREAIAEIRRRIDEPIYLAELAVQAGLSAGRFRHIFVAETGLSFRAFVLWERLNRALALGFGGASWTEAAHAANFSDSAHLSRTCRRTFDFAPTGARVERFNVSGSRSA